MKAIKKIEDVANPKVGSFYLVPCVEYTIFGDKFQPVIGTPHEDADLGVCGIHYHYDIRFFSKRRLTEPLPQRWRNEGQGTIPFRLGRVLAPSGEEIEKLPIIYKKIKMRRQMPKFPFRPQVTGKLQEKYKDVKMSCLTCPHRGMPLNGLPVNKGRVVCNGHGLQWDIATGKMIPRNFRMKRD